MCVAHRPYLEQPTVLPFFCALLYLSRSLRTMETIDDVVRTSFRSAFLCSLVFLETFVSDTGQKFVSFAANQLQCLDLTDF